MVTPAGLRPPHRITHFDKLGELIAAFTEAGWDHTKPALVGYRVWPDGPIQLLSGTHRREAALVAKLAVPVVVWDRREVEGAYGDLDKWTQIMHSGHPS